MLLVLDQGDERPVDLGLERHTSTLAHQDVLARVEPEWTERVDLSRRTQRSLRHFFMVSSGHRRRLGRNVRVEGGGPMEWTAVRATLMTMVVLVMLVTPALSGAPGGADNDRAIELIGAVLNTGSS